MNAPLKSGAPQHLHRLIQELSQRAQTGRETWGEAIGTIPVSHYTSRARWEAEQSALFKGLPIVAAHSSELPPGHALPFDDLGIPLVLTRDASGRARAFMNVCRHRGMTLLPPDTQGRAEKRASLVCPYHGWTFELDGRLRHRLHAQAFEGFDPTTLDLVEVACDEVAGLVFVRLQEDGRRAATLDAAQWLGEMAHDLSWLQLARMQVFRRIDVVKPANWKLTADAFLEGYHIRVLHQDTIWPFFADLIIAQDWVGPHSQSLVGRRKALEGFDPQATTPSDLCRLSTPTQLLFPNSFLIWHPDYVSLIRMFSPAPDQVRWIHTMLIPPEKSGADWTPHWEKTFRLMEQTVFQKEDVYAAECIQRGFASGANEVLTIGRLENNMLSFHEEIERRVQQDAARQAG